MYLRVTKLKVDIFAHVTPPGKTFAWVLIITVHDDNENQSLPAGSVGRGKKL